MTNEIHSAPRVRGGIISSLHRTWKFYGKNRTTGMPAWLRAIRSSMMNFVMIIFPGLTRLFPRLSRQQYCVSFFGYKFRPRRWSILIVVLIIYYCPVSHLFAGEPDTLTQFGEFRDAVAIAIDPGGTIYVLDRGSNQLLKYSPAGNLLLSTGGYGWEGASFDRPSDFSLTEGIDIYVADYGNHRIVRLDRQGTFVEGFNLRGDDPSGSYGYPSGIAQSRFGDIFVIDGDNRQLISIGSTRTVQNSFGGIGSGKGTLHKPVKIRISADDRLYVLDDSVLVMFDLFGNYLGQVPGTVGGAVSTFSIDGQSLYSLIGSSISLFDESGQSKHIMDLAAATENIDPRDVVDFVVRGNRIFFLLKRSVIIRPVAIQ